jgi:DNA-3-methyladenine glycosylase
LEIMRLNRPGVEDKRLCRGPGALCAAFGITGALDGADLLGPELQICSVPEAFRTVRSTTRIGLTKAADRPWRFIARDSEYLSGTKRLNSSIGE